MKKLMTLILAAAMVLTLFAGCGTKTDAPTDAAASEGGKGNGLFLGTKTDATTDAANELSLVTPGKLTVCLSPDFAPMEFVDPSKSGQDQYVGFDVTLAKYLADELGLELVIMPMDFGACQTAVEMGTVDMAISGFSKTDERAQHYNLSDFYYAGDNETEQVLITLAGNEGKYTTAESVAGLKVGAQAASLQANLCTNQLPNTELVVFGDLTTGLLQLKNGDFDVMAVADGNADAIISSNPDIIKTGFEFTVTSDEENNVILLKKGNDALTAKVNELLAKAYDAGYYGDWYAQAKELAGIGVEVSYDENGNPVEG